MAVSTHAIPFCGPRGGAVRAEEEVAIDGREIKTGRRKKEEEEKSVFFFCFTFCFFYITPSRDLPGTTTTATAFFLAAGLLYSYFLATTPTKNTKLTAEIPASMR